MAGVVKDQETFIPAGFAGRIRRAGVLIGVAGTLLLAIFAGNVPAGTTSGEDGGDEPRGSGTGETIYGGSGLDAMFGGPGDDFIEAKDGARDSVVCGAGQDVVSADEKDLVSRDCEIIYKA